MRQEKLPKGCKDLETHPESPFLANANIENKGLLAREIAKKRLSGFVSRHYLTIGIAFVKGRQCIQVMDLGCGDGR